MGASMLYEVHEPLPDARSALLFARDLPARFGTGEPDPPALAFGDIATREQFLHARRYFTGGAFSCSQSSLGDPRVRELWGTLDSLGLRDSCGGWVETELQHGLASL